MPPSSDDLKVALAQQVQDFLPLWSRVCRLSWTRYWVEPRVAVSPAFPGFWPGSGWNNINEGVAGNIVDWRLLINATIDKVFLLVGIL